MGNRQSHQSADADTLRRAQTAANTKKNARDPVQPPQKQETIPVLPSSPIRNPTVEEASKEA